MNLELIREEGSTGSYLKSSEFTIDAFGNATIEECRLYNGADELIASENCLSGVSFTFDVGEDNAGIGGLSPNLSNFDGEMYEGVSGTSEIFTVKATVGTDNAGDSIRTTLFVNSSSPGTSSGWCYLEGYRKRRI